MPIFEVLTIEVGAAIAKSILKLWLKDSEPAADISSSIIDVLKSRTSDMLAQRRGQRQFEKIGEMVGESLLPLFESEGARLDEGGQIAVAYEVAAAFNTSKLSSALLAEQNLEPTKLAKHVLAGHSIAGQPFSETEKAFYRRIIEESCSYVVDIASQLPVFTERTFAEVLKREDQIITTTNQILQEVRRIHEQLGTSEADFFEEQYRKGVVRKLDVIQLFGTDVSTANRRHRLSVAYITLSVEAESVPTSDNGHHIPLEETLPVEISQSETDREIVAVDIALARSRCILIRGLAGSGKTTLLQWIAVRSALKSFEGDLTGWNNTLPFFIRLRDRVQTRLPAPEAFPGLVVSSIADTMPRGWVHTQLTSGRAIVLVDGLDEVSSSYREDVRTWLKELVETYPKTRFIITSRPHAIEEGWMDHEGFSDAELQPMQLADMYSFIDHWHKAVREELYEDEERAELGAMAEHLKSDVKGNRAIRNLATNPLLCAMLCALNRDRRQQLPADRLELYEACCSLLLERRDKERRIELTGDYPSFNYRQKRLLLEDLAYWMIKNGWSQVKRERVDERFDRKLKDMPGITRDVTGIGVRRLFVERAGLIREPVAEQIDFTHRTFQEFLAAKAAADEIDTGLLVENADNDQWREVIILVSGLATKQMREDLIKGLIARGDTDKKHQYQLHLLAVSCYETSVELGQEVRSAVEQRLSKLVPPRNMIVAEALAAAGELAVKYLANKGKRTAATDAACVRTLALIGGDAALDILKEYATDTRTAVVNELLKGWDYFDKDTYARHIVSQTFETNPGISLELLSSLDGFQYLTNLSSLSLSGCGQISDLSPLAGLTTLSSLNLSKCEQISDLSPLAGLTTLSSLNLSKCEQISDLSPLAGLTTLSALDLQGCGRVRDLSPLASLTTLSTLILSGCGQISDLSPLAGLITLSGLNLYGCGRVLDLSPLAGLTTLSALNLRDCGQISDLSPLAGLTNLSYLNLSWCRQISDLSSLAGLTNLSFLDLRGCERVRDLKVLSKLKDLRVYE